MASPTELTFTRLTVRGTLPVGLSGQLVGIGSDGLTHSVHVNAGRAVAYRLRRMTAGSVVRHIVVFGGAILAITDEGLAVELSWDLDILRQVDLAGRGRKITEGPTLDPSTGELHLLVVDASGARTHVVVSAGGLTRSSRSVTDEQPVGSVASSTDFAFVADGGWLVGFVPVALRDETDFVVRDSLVLAGAAIATVRIPRSIPRGSRCTWIPSTHQTTTTQTTTQGEVK